MKQADIDALYAAIIRPGAPSVKLNACKVLEEAWRHALSLPDDERNLPLPTVVAQYVLPGNDPADFKVRALWVTILDLTRAVGAACERIINP